MSKRQAHIAKAKGERSLIVFFIVAFGVIGLFASPYIFAGDVNSPDVDLEDYGSLHVFYNVMSMGVPTWTAEILAGAPAYNADVNFNSIGISHLRLPGEDNYINEGIVGMLYCKDTGQKLGSSPNLIIHDIFYGDYMYWGFPKGRLLAGEHTYYVVLYGMFDEDKSIGAQTIVFDIDYSGGEGVLLEPTVGVTESQYSATTSMPIDVIFSYTNLWSDANWAIFVDGGAVDDAIGVASKDGETHDVVFVFTPKAEKIYDISFMLSYSGERIRVDTRVVSVGDPIPTTTTTNSTVTNTTSGTTNGTTDGGFDWSGYVKELERERQELMFIMVATVAVFSAIMLLMVYSGRRRR